MVELITKFLCRTIISVSIVLNSCALENIEQSLEKLQQHLSLLANTITPMSSLTHPSSISSPKQQLYEYLKHIAQSKNFTKSVSWHYLSQEPLGDRIDFEKLMPTKGKRYLYALPTDIAKDLSLNKEIQQLYKNNHLPLEQLFSREVEYADTHEVFYHAHKGDVRILQDLFRSLANFFYQYKNQDFIYLRNSIRDESVEKIIKDIKNDIPKQDASINETDENIQKALLSVNLHLFALVFDNMGSSTILYYAQNRSQIYNPSLVTKLLDTYGLQANDAFQKVLKIALAGNLLQVFIPKEQVPHCVYLARSFGIVISADPEQYRALLHCTILNKPQPYCLHQPSLDDLEGRIILDYDIMLNPNSGVTIFRYTQDSQDVDKQYNQQFEKAINEMLIDWLNRLKKNGIKQEVLTRIASTTLGQQILRYDESLKGFTPQESAIDAELAKLKRK